MKNAPWQLRPACNFDGLEIACLIDRVFREYDDRLAPRRGEQDLTDIERHYWQSDGAFVVLEEDHDWVNVGEVIGSAAMVPGAAPKVCTLRRFYVDSRRRGRRAALQLATWAIDWAVLRGFERIEFWSDTRFERGHAFFEKIGLERTSTTREVGEGVMPYRELFLKGEVEVLRKRLRALAES